MGASFRNLGEIVELAGCDLLTIAPNLLDELQKTDGQAPAQARSRARPQAMKIERIPMDEAASARMHEEDRMANEKLDEGIEGFSKAIVALEKLLAEAARRARGPRARPQAPPSDFFGVYDLDGDGVITREEWAGTDAVFAALDSDGDGRITPAELAAGARRRVHCLRGRPRNMAAEKAQFGMIGMAVMGRNLALNIADHGFRSPSATASPTSLQAAVEGERRQARRAASRSRSSSTRSSGRAGS